MLAYAVAEHLATEIDALTFTPEASGGNVFLEDMPNAPDLAVMVSGQPGLPQLSRLATDLPGLQVIVRAGSYGAVAGHAVARSIYSELTCLDGVVLAQDGPHEVRVISCTASQSDPTPIGRDDNERPEWSLNFQLRVHAPTTHRP